MANDSILPERRLWAPRLRTPWYPDKLLPQIQDTLATLADIEARYETERKHLQTQAGSDAATRCFAAELEGRYQRERESCIRQLAALHQRLGAITGFGDLRLIS